MSEYDACAAEDRGGCVERRYGAGVALAYVYNYNATFDSSADDGCHTPIFAFRGVSRAEGLENQPSETGYS